MRRRGQMAGCGLAVVLLGLGAFGVWASRATSSAVDNAVAASDLSDDYTQASRAVAAEESLERKYRLEPGPAVRDRFDSAAAALLTALGDISGDGAAEDQALVDIVLGQHQVYLAGVDRLFAATDRGDTSSALHIDAAEVDPAFAEIEETIIAAADRHRSVALADLEHLDRLESVTQQMTPIVVLVGMFLAALLASVTRWQRRALDSERTSALHRSSHDALTGLPNRALLSDRCVDALRANSRNGSRCALLLVDLDRFKEINDTFGHHIGDELLVQVGPRLASAVSSADTVGRLGGDEFGILLADVPDVHCALVVAAELRVALRTAFRVADVDFDVDASIGVAMSDERSDATTMLQHADVAMYVAKSRSCGVFAYDRTIDHHTPARVALLGDLRRAIERDELVLHYQPKVGLGTGDIVGVEALVRWPRPGGGFVFPDDFIPLAERTGLITALTNRVLNTALAQARVWADAGRPLCVAVNLSARNLLEEGLAEGIAGMIAAHGVGPELLELEVTESALMSEPVRARDLLERLSDLGIRISIDDFGAGYTSLGQLKDLPIKELKIDRSFVTTLTTDASNAVIVQSVIELGHNLGLTIVAEGVEDGSTMARLAGLGCDVAQGYHVARPVSADAFDAWRARVFPDRAGAQSAGGSADDETVPSEHV